MACIVVVEDEQDLQQVLGYNLRQAGHEVLPALDGESGLQLARERHPDLVLLDLMLPGMPGTEVCARLKRDPATREVPVLMLTARGEETDRVAGFELGADDYVTKPFSVPELLLRIAAILRRYGTDEDAPAPVELGRLRVDPGAHRVWVDGREVRLTAIELRLLLTLLERRDRVQTRSTLLDDVWGREAEITARAVDTHVKRLRQKLGPVASYVETVRGAGYRFVSRPEDARR